MSKEHPIDWRGDLWKKREFFCESPPVRGGMKWVPVVRRIRIRVLVLSSKVMASFRKADSTGIFIAGV